MPWSEFYILIGSAAVKLLCVFGPLAPSLWPHAGQYSTRMGLAEQFKWTSCMVLYCMDDLIGPLDILILGSEQLKVCGKSRSVAFVATNVRLSRMCVFRFPFPFLLHGHRILVAGVPSPFSPKPGN